MMAGLVFRLQVSGIFIMAILAVRRYSDNESPDGIPQEMVPAGLHGRQGKTGVGGWPVSVRVSGDSDLGLPCVEGVSPSKRGQDARDTRGARLLLRRPDRSGPRLPAQCQRILTRTTAICTSKSAADVVRGRFLRGEGVPPSLPGWSRGPKSEGKMPSPRRAGACRESWLHRAGLQE
jgi:hypothetical protein